LLSIVLAFVVRCLLVTLFLPFSALDKILNFGAAISQAEQQIPHRRSAMLLIAGGFLIEVVMSIGVLTGIADRFAALVLAIYCLLTALFWKQFWKNPRFELKGRSTDRAVFWDFLKNLALAGGFLLLTFGSDASGVKRFMSHPLASSHPYSAEIQQ
jgi:putative oxidoreductase